MKNKFSLFSAFKCAFEGIIATVSERNFKIELCFMVLVILLGLFFSISPLEWVCVIICCGVVLGGEVINSSIEAIVDLVSPDYHELAKKAKDCAAGGVLLFSLASFIVGCVMFLPRILHLIGWL